MSYFCYGLSRANLKNHLLKCLWWKQIFLYMGDKKKPIYFSDHSSITKKNCMFLKITRSPQFSNLASSIFFKQRVGIETDLFDPLLTRFMLTKPLLAWCDLDLNPNGQFVLSELFHLGFLWRLWWFWLLSIFKLVNFGSFQSI